LSALPEGSVVGTSSVRRAAQIQAKYPKLKIKDVRGNLNTRLKKLDDPNQVYAALVLAAAGVLRMDWGHRITQVRRKKVPSLLILVNFPDPNDVNCSFWKVTSAFTLSARELWVLNVVRETLPSWTSLAIFTTETLC
jgi:hypothetical protein